MVASKRTPISASHPIQTAVDGLDMIENVQSIFGGRRSASMMMDGTGARKYGRSAFEAHDGKRPFCVRTLRLIFVHD